MITRSKVVPVVNTPYRNISTPIPHPEDIWIIDAISKFESRLSTKELPVVWDRAIDATVYDRWGNFWIDMSSSIFVTNTGHSNKRMKSKILDAVEKDLLHAYCYPTKERAEFLKKLIEVTPAYLEKATLVSTGTEASERAIKLTRMHGAKFSPTKKYIIGGCGNYHGKTMGAMMAATTPEARKWIGYQDPFMLQMPFPFPWILEENSVDGEQLFKEHINSILESGVNKDDIAGFIIESYQGWAAVFYPVDYIQAMKEWAKENNALLVVDEIQSGFGRTGKLFGYEHYGIVPDLVCCGKGISGGMPLSAVLGSEDLIELDSSLTSTHGGHPVACAGALGNLEALFDDGLLARGALLGQKLHTWLLEWQQIFPDRITRIFGHGMVWGVFICKPNSKELDISFVNKLVDRLLEKGVFSIRTGCGTVKLGPPLCISEGALKEAIDVHVEAMAELLEEKF